MSIVPLIDITMKSALSEARKVTPRSHLITRAGHRRDRVVFSVIDTEWPIVKRRLAHLLNIKPIIPEEGMGQVHSLTNRARVRLYK